LPDVFSQKTEEDKRLFNLLQKAYISTRYKEDYKISADDLVCLTEKVRCIHEILSGATPVPNEHNNTHFLHIRNQTTKT
jgi:hypothetical protein